MEKKKPKLSLKELCTKFIPTIKKIFNYLKEVEFNKKMKLIGEILLLIVLLCLLKLPFSIARDLIINVFFSVEIANTLLMNMLYIIFGLPYYILVVYLFVNTIVTKYEDIEVVAKVQEDTSLSSEMPITKNEEQIILPNDGGKEKKEISQSIEQDSEVPSLADNPSFTNNENVEKKLNS